MKKKSRRTKFVLENCRASTTNIRSLHPHMNKFNCRLAAIAIVVRNSFLFERKPFAVVARNLHVQSVHSQSSVVSSWTAMDQHGANRVCNYLYDLCWMGKGPRGRERMLYDLILNTNEYVWVLFHNECSCAKEVRHAVPCVCEPVSVWMYYNI